MIIFESVEVGGTRKTKGFLNYSQLSDFSHFMGSSASPHRDLTNSGDFELPPPPTTSPLGINMGD